MNESNKQRRQTSVVVVLGRNEGEERTGEERKEKGVGECGGGEEERRVNITCGKFQVCFRSLDHLGALAHKVDFTPVISP